MKTRVLSTVTMLDGVGGIFIFSRGRRKKKDEIEEEESYKASLLCRFVLDGLGRKIGESVAVDEDIVIIKSGGKYLGVPLKHIEENEKTLMVKGLVNQEKAEEMGEKWRQNSLSEIDTDDLLGETKDGF